MVGSALQTYGHVHFQVDLYVFILTFWNKVLCSSILPVNGSKVRVYYQHKVLL